MSKRDDSQDYLASVEANASAYRKATEELLAKICDVLGASPVEGALAGARRVQKERDALTAQLRARDEALRVARARMLEVVGSMSDVVSLGRFSRAVDPVRWVEQVKASADAALAAIEEAGRV